MSELIWDSAGHRFFETGISCVTLYLWDPINKRYGPGVAWNGITRMDQTADGGDLNHLWADNIKYGSIRSHEDFKGSIGAHQYPEVFKDCNGEREAAPGVSITCQSRKTFGLAYRTEIGNDVNQNAGFKLHLIYGCTVNPGERSRETISDSPDAIEYEWDYDTMPVVVIGHKPTSHITVDSRYCDPSKLALFEQKLFGFGKDEEEGIPYLPLPDEIYDGTGIFTDEYPWMILDIAPLNGSMLG